MGERRQPKHPMQPLVEVDGVVRFKQNAIVRYLVDKNTGVLNDIAAIDFPREDREQFAQLIGYSLGGFGELSYVRNETYAAAQSMHGSNEAEHHFQVRKFACMQAFRTEVMKQPWFNEDMIVLQARAELAARLLHSVRYEWPADWWQAFRERWLPRWWLERRPVRYEVRHVQVSEFVHLRGLPDGRSIVAVTEGMV